MELESAWRVPDRCKEVAPPKTKWTCAGNTLTINLAEIAVAGSLTAMPSKNALTGSGV